ncbi:MAG TPA: glycosyltransferase family 1 protein [Vicinamibacterales bacterium]|nr:glycosyltransferase family 1 protein [Vicinamibacterales bacterium]
MRILLDYRPALRQRTGVGEYVHHLADALLRAVVRPGDEVMLFSSSLKDRLPAGVLPEADRRDLRIPVRVLNAAWHRLEWPPVERFGLRPDVAWSLHPLLMPTRRAARVLTVYDLYFLDHPEDTAREIRRDYAALAARHVARADAIITISEYTRQRTAARFGVPAERITVCHPGAPAWPRREAPQAPGPILHVGTIEPRKNVPALLRAYAELLRRDPGVPDLVFAGRAAMPVDRLLAGLDAAASRRVRFQGYVSDDERQRLYREASVLVIPSADEGFGMPAVEAMTVGLPVIAAARGALPEVVGDAGLLLDPDDPTALADAMQRVLADEGLRAELADRGVARATRFNWEGSARQLYAAFGEARVRREARG